MQIQDIQAKEKTSGKIFFWKMKNIKKYNDHIKTYQLRYIKQIIFKKYYYSFRIKSGKNKTQKNTKRERKKSIFFG